MGYKVNKIRVGTQQVRPNDILLYLPMNTDLSDHSGNNISIQNTGVSINTSVLSGRGVASFPGISVNNYLIFDLGTFPTECTVSFWMKSTKNKSAYFSSYRTSNVSNNVVVTQAENTGRYFSAGLFNSSRISSSTLPFDGNWHNIVLIWDGTNFKLFLDKTQLGSVTYTYSSSADGKFNFGGSAWDGRGWVYGGYMAEAKLLNIAWEQSDVNSNYDSEKSIFGI